MTKIFISYCHKQGKWVKERLLPCLKAGGVAVLIDGERFKGGEDLYQQMDAWQDQADKHLLVLSQDYLDSAPCRHEMDRAIALDPDFTIGGIVIPVLRVDCPLPDKIKKPIYIDLRDDKKEDKWDLLFNTCGADLGVNAAAWLRARDEIVRYLRDNQSVNLNVNASSKILKWKELIEHIASDYFPDLAIVDLQSYAATSREGFLQECLKALGLSASLPDRPHDLKVFGDILFNRGLSRIAFLRFDQVQQKPYLDADLFSALRDLQEKKKLVFLIQSKTPFASLLPTDHPLSYIDIKTVELRR